MRTLSEATDGLIGLLKEVKFRGDRFFGKEINLVTVNHVEHEGEIYEIIVKKIS